MDIYDSIASALDMTPIQLDFNLIEMIESGQIEILSYAESNSGSNNPMYGKKHTEEHKKYLSDIGKQLMTVERKAKLSLMMSGESNPMYGKTHTDSAKNAIGEKAKSRPKIYGRKLSEQTRQVNIERFKAMPKISCPHCNKETDRGNYNRWHGVNCKLANHKT